MHEKHFIKYAFFQAENTPCPLIDYIGNMIAKKVLQINPYLFKVSSKLLETRDFSLSNFTESLFSHLPVSPNPVRATQTSHS